MDRDHITDPEVILTEMEQEIEAAVMRARHRLAAIESTLGRSPEPSDESAPTPEG